MRKLEIRGGKQVEGSLGSPQGFHLYCNDNTAIIICDTFADAAYLPAENMLYGHSVRVAKGNTEKNTARAILVSDCGADVMQKGGRNRVIAQVNYASDLLAVPASELRPFFIGELTKRSDDEATMRSIAACVNDVKAGRENTIVLRGTRTHTVAVQFYLGDDYVCKIAGTVFTDVVCPMTKRTLLLTTDVSVSQELLELALRTQMQESFGLFHVPTSANDGVIILSSGCAGNNKIEYKDVEFLKFCKALQFILCELCGMLISDGRAENAIFLQVTGAKSRQFAGEVVRNAYSYFSLLGTEKCDLLKGFISCIGNVDSTVKRKRLKVWLSSDAGRVLLIDGARILYVSPEKTEGILSSTNATVTVDFGEGNYSASGWINKLQRKVVNY